VVRKNKTRIPGEPSEARSQRFFTLGRIRISKINPSSAPC
jgi:hypothetical protein